MQFQFEEYPKPEAGPLGFDDLPVGAVFQVSQARSRNSQELRYIYVKMSATKAKETSDHHEFIWPDANYTVTRVIGVLATPGLLQPFTPPEEGYPWVPFSQAQSGDVVETKNGWRFLAVRKSLEQVDAQWLTSGGKPVTALLDSTCFVGLDTLVRIIGRMKVTL